jgi:putative ABC transport system permease protein
LGQFAAYFSVVAVEKTISTMYSTVSISDYLITKRDILISLAVGLFVSLLASFIPALEASKIRPNESSREGSFEDKYKKYQALFFSAGFLFVTTGIIISYIDYRSAPFEFPVLAYIGILFIIAGFTFFSPFYLRIFLGIVKRPLEKIFKSTGKITLGDMRGNTYRFSVALMSVAISGALIVALLTLIFSFRSSLMGWIHKNITADVYIKPASCKSNYCFYPLSEKVIDIVKRLPEVEGVDKFRGLSLELFGKKVVTGFADVGVKRKYLERKYIDREYESILQEMEGEEPVVGISDYLSLKYGMKVGDILMLQTPRGEKEFRINDVFSSYSTTSGFMYIDRKWLRDYWNMDDATQISVYLGEDAEVALFIHKLRGILSAYSLEIMNNQELRTKVLNIFDKSFAITYAIELISIVVSLIGIINTLLALVFEHKREISIIRYLGGSWRQIQQNLMLAAGIVGISGIMLGMLLGPLMSIIFILVVNKVSFGWTIHFKIPFSYLSMVTIILFTTTLFAGLLPSKVARRIEPKRFVSFE